MGVRDDAARLGAAGGNYLGRRVCMGCLWVRRTGRHPACGRPKCLTTVKRWVERSQLANEVLVTGPGAETRRRTQCAERRTRTPTDAS